MLKIRSNVESLMSAVTKEDKNIAAQSAAGLPSVYQDKPIIDSVSAGVQTIFPSDHWPLFLSVVPFK